MIGFLLSPHLWEGMRSPPPFVPLSISPIGSEIIVHSNPEFNPLLVPIVVCAIAIKPHSPCAAIKILVNLHHNFAI